MRKFFIFVAFIICFIIVGFCKYDAINFSLEECANPKYYFYVSLNNAEQVSDSHYIRNGEGGIIALNQNELDLLDSFDISKIYGKSIQFGRMSNNITIFCKEQNLKWLKLKHLIRFQQFTDITKSLGKVFRCMEKK